MTIREGKFSEKIADCCSTRKLLFKRVGQCQQYETCALLPSKPEAWHYWNYMYQKKASDTVLLMTGQQCDTYYWNCCVTCDKEAAQTICDIQVVSQPTKVLFNWLVQWSSICKLSFGVWLTYGLGAFEDMNDGAHAFIHWYDKNLNIHYILNTWFTHVRYP